MYKEGYTVLTGPVKNAPKGDQAVRKAEKAGEHVEYIKKQEHANKHAPLEGHQIARIMNEEEDHKRKGFLIQPPRSLKIFELQFPKPATRKGGLNNSLHTKRAFQKQISTLGKQEKESPRGFKSQRWTKFLESSSQEPSDIFNILIRHP